MCLIIDLMVGYINKWGDGCLSFNLHGTTIILLQVVVPRWVPITFLSTSWHNYHPVAGCCAMLSAQCGCLLSCLVITLLQHRTQATATTSSTTTATASTTHEHRQAHQQNHPQKQQKTVDNQTAESEADTESEFVHYTVLYFASRYSKLT